MKINKLNYESFLIDYLENQLDDKQIELLKLFINQNPELGTWEELTEDLPFINSESVSFDRKSTLYKKEIIATTHISETNYEEFFVAFSEGLLSKEEQAEVQQFLVQNPELQKDFNLFGLAKLEADTNIQYPQKENLYKKTQIVSLLMRGVSIAAALALFVGIAWFFINHEPNNREQLAEIQKIEMKHLYHLESDNQISLRERDFQPIVLNQIDEPEDEYFAFNTIPALDTKYSESICWTQGAAIIYDDDIEQKFYYFDKYEYLASVSDLVQKEGPKTFSNIVHQNIAALAKRINKAQKTSKNFDEVDKDFIFSNITKKSIVLYSFLSNKNISIKKDSGDK